MRVIKNIKIFFFVLIFLYTANFEIFAADTEASRLATIKYGTENEISTLIQTLKNEKAYYLDDELVLLIGTTKNSKILSGIFSFFGDREKKGLEDRAVKALSERENEANETVLAAIDYLGNVKAKDAVLALMEVIDSKERRFLNNSIRALGKASSANKESADDTAEFLVDFYNDKNPGSDNQRDIINALGQTGSAKAVPMLVDIASNTDERIPLRMAALEALSKIGDKDSLEAILGCVSTNDPNVRSSAVAALGPFSGEDVDKAILDAFRDSYYRTRIAAAQASKDRKFIEAIPYLAYRAERDDVPNVKDEAIKALGEIANEQAIEVLDSLFADRKNPDRVRILSAEMLVRNNGNKYLGKLVIELDEAKVKNQTALTNGFLKIVGEAVIKTNTSEIENTARRFLQNGTLMEKLYGLDMAANNNLKSLEADIKKMAADKNEGISRKARQTAEKLGIVID